MPRLSCKPILTDPSPHPHPSEASWHVQELGSIQPQVGPRRRPWVPTAGLRACSPRGLQAVEKIGTKLPFTGHSGERSSSVAAPAQGSGALQNAAAGVPPPAPQPRHRFAPSQPGTPGSEVPSVWKAGWGPGCRPPRGGRSAGTHAARPRPDAWVCKWPVWAASWLRHLRNLPNPFPQLQNPHLQAHEHSAQGLPGGVSICGEVWMPGGYTIFSLSFRPQGRRHSSAPRPPSHLLPLYPLPKGKALLGFTEEEN